jgi:hypothetical protein
MKREKELTQLRAVHSPLLARQPARRWMTGCAPDEEEQSSRVGSSLPQPRDCGRACVKWQTLAADDSRSPRQLALASRVKHVRQGSRSSAPLRSRRLVWTALDPAARPKRFESDDFLPRKMRPSGLEPPRGNLPTRPSTLFTAARCFRWRPNRPIRGVSRTHRTHLEERVLPRCCHGSSPGKIRPCLFNRFRRIWSMAFVSPIPID